MLAMDAPWVGSMTPVAPPRSASPTVRQLVYAGVVTGAWSGIACLVIYAIARLAGVPFVLTAPGQTSAQVPWIAVLIVPLIAAVLGALLASLARGWNHAGRLVLLVGTLLALASCLPVVLQPDTVGWSTRILLIVMHAVTWFLVVPQIARIVGDSEPSASVERAVL
jgi:hypothetical protein